MSEVTQSARCGHCGADLPESPELPPEQRVPCSSCGSTTRAIEVCISETVLIRGKLGMQGRHGDAKKPYIESVVGDDLYRKTGKWMKLSRVIDRENNLYVEEVKDPETGQIVHRCEIPLNEHRVYGSAKNRNDSSKHQHKR